MKMRIGIVLAFAANVVVINCQSAVDDKLTPFIQLTRLILSDLIKPRTFEAGYQISLRNNVR